MTEVDEHGRVEPPHAADEVATLRGFLDHQRATFAWRCSGLDAAALGTRVAASSMTLGGMLKHLACVEVRWFSQRLRDRDPDGPWAHGDWDLDPDWDWNSAAADPPERLRALWADAVALSQAALDEALLDGGVDGLCARSLPDGTRPSVRWILVHMVEEYARHNGHADLIRESIDGVTGE